MHYRLDISYIGTPFHGWQSQSSGNSIQDFLERSIHKITGERIRLKSAARTDSGVHAEAQVATMTLEQLLDPERLRLGIQAHLPKEISVNRIRLVEESFHPIKSALGKAYRYRLWLGPVASAFCAPYCWRVRPDLDLASMKRAAVGFIGKHDFSSFCAADSTAASKSREIFEVELVSNTQLLEIWVAGDGFLKQMVRTLVGTLVEVGRGRIKSEQISEILLARDRKQAGPTAPSQGLCLVDVFYEKQVGVEKLRNRASSGFSMALPENP